MLKVVFTNERIRLWKKSCICKSSVEDNVPRVSRIVPDTATTLTGLVDPR